MTRPDATTREWIRNASDERAASRGARFNVERAIHVTDFFRQHLVLYEGERAGQPFNLLEWQVDLLARAFGWEVWSEFYGRHVRRFKKVSVWKPKKNGKSPTLAGIGCYLTIADGEQGQKIYTAALDGKQARIAHEHAVKMIEMSPTLSKVCKAHKGTGRIVYPKTNSFYDILAGDNVKGQEGRNASILIDETHVVDARLARVIEYAGISRAESMYWSFSTAGNDPESFGRKEQDYGRAVEAGDVDDDGFLFHCHEAPQNATDKELTENRKLWYTANPSLGEILNEEEFSQSMQRALNRGVSDWQQFKMYRLNIWADAELPWLRRDDWRAAKSERTAKDFEGRECWLGLDLAKTCDLTAAVLVFRNDAEDGTEPTYTLLPFFWLPAAEARKQSHRVGYLDWAKAGHISLIDGKSVDYQIVERDIAELAKRFEIQQVLYDPKYAEELTQRLELEHDIPRLEFPQTLMHFAGPTAAFERLLIAGKLKHLANPVMDWQIGHAEVKADLNGNKRPVKPKDDTGKKIDGVVAGIMALYGAMQGVTAGSFYDDNDAELV